MESLYSSYVIFVCFKTFKNVILGNMLIEIFFNPLTPRSFHIDIRDKIQERLLSSTVL